MASIQKRGNSYRIFVSNGMDNKGKQIIETATFTPDPKRTDKQNDKALTDFVYEFEKKVKDGNYLDGEKITFKEFAEKWLQEYVKKQLAPTTLQEYTRILHNNIYPSIGNIPLSKIQPLKLLSFYNHLADSNYSYATIKKNHNLISKIYNTAIEWQIVTDNPCNRIKPPKPSHDEYEQINFFNLEQTELFLSLLGKPQISTYRAHGRIDDTGKQYFVNEYKETRYIPLQLKVFFHIAIFGGLRRGEILALTWDDIDFEKQSVSVSKTAVLVDGKIINKKPKTKSSNRMIMLPDIAMDTIKEHQEKQPPNKNGFLFTQSNGNQMYTSTPYLAFKRIIKRYNEQCANDCDKLPEITLHGLRHTSATLLIGSNLDIRTVSGRLGHSQASTTMNIYAHALRELDRKASKELDNLFRK